MLQLNKIFPNFLNRTKMRAAILLCLALPAIISARTIKFSNRCGHDIWVSPLTNAQGPELSPGIVKLGNGGDFTYQIPDSGWGGRFWPKQGKYPDYIVCSSHFAPISFN